MAIRTCPLCMVKNPPGAIVAYSETLSCSRCGKPLEIASPSRLISSTAGLLAAFVVYRFTKGSSNLLGWVLPIVYAIVTWGLVAPLVLMLSADLRVRAEQPYAELRDSGASAGHTAHH